MFIKSTKYAVSSRRGLDCSPIVLTKNKSAQTHVCGYDFLNALAQRSAHGGEHIFAGIGGDWGLGFFVGVFDEFFGEFFQELRRVTGQKLAVFFSAATVADGQRLLRARDGDVEQSALFIERTFDFGT